MKKIYSLIVLSLFSLTLQAQTYVLRAQNFEDTTAIAALLNNVPLQTESGPNRWIINKEYVGQPSYPNTPSQDSTYAGQIYNAPYSRCLHIYDSTTAFVTSQAIVNGNYDPSVASDNFAIVDVNGVCTMGMDTVHVSFFYTCEGSPNAYAELYYSRDGGGSWFQVGQPKYNNKSKWQYEILSDPGFVNASDLIFGFRWVNNNGSPPAPTSFSMDDFLIAGHASSVQTSINFTTIINDTMCIGHYLFMFFSLSDTLCDGWYQVLMSDLTGSFIMPTQLGVFPIFSPQTTGGVAIFLDNSLFPGDCYRFTFQRISPAYPPIFIDTTVCIKIEWCPDTIQTSPLGPPVITLDPLDSNSVCAGSVIDVQFFSKGTFDITNHYKLQLSDVNGNFVHPDSAGAIIIGDLPSSITYDPTNPTPGYPPPGGVGGKIPDTMSTGCSYRIRIIATSPILPPPPLVGSTWGPFCIKHCDIITNDEHDLVNGGLCLLNTPICTTLTVDVNFYDSTTTYGFGNQFMVQVLSTGAPGSPPPMYPVGPLGCLGKVAAIGDTTLQFCIGPMDSMLTWGIMPNTPYYLRIVATNSSNPANAYGSVVRFQYSFKVNYAPIVEVLDGTTGLPITHVCHGQTVRFHIVNPPPSPLDQYTTFQWTSPNLAGPILRTWPNFDLTVIFTISNFTFTVTCRVLGAPGCISPATTKSIVVYGKPNVAILPGNATVCVGKKITYHTNLFGQTYFTWSASSPHVIMSDTANNYASFTFDSVGTYTISVYASNPCFDSTGYKTITVIDPPIADAGPDSVAICTGSQVTLVTSPIQSGWTFSWKLGNNAPLGTNDSLTVNPTTNTEYFIYVTNPGCTSKDSITVTIEQPPKSYFTDTVCIDHTPIVLDPGITAQYHHWSSGDSTQQIAVTDTGSYTDTLQVSGETCYRIYTYTVGYAYPDSADQNTFFCSGDPTVLDAAEPGATGYHWSTGDTTSSQITITTPGTYWVDIAIPGQRCAFTRMFNVIEDPQLCPDTTSDIELIFKLPNVFTPNGDKYNEFFKALTYGNYSSFGIKIFNRWGELVFESADQHFEWDGKNPDGKDCTAGVYYYVGNLVHPEDTRSIHGTVTLIR